MVIFLGILLVIWLLLPLWVLFIQWNTGKIKDEIRNLVDQIEKMGWVEKVRKVNAKWSISNGRKSKNGEM